MKNDVKCIASQKDTQMPIRSDQSGLVIKTGRHIRQIFISQGRLYSDFALKFFILDMKLVECNLPCKFGRKALPKISKEKMQTEPINDVNEGAKHDVQGQFNTFSPKNNVFEVTTQQLTKVQNQRVMERKMIERRMSDFENEK